MNDNQVDMGKVNKKIPLMECFGPTFQGEGILAGRQTFFLRFGLCDYDCAMCDSRHSVDPGQVKANAEYLTQEEIAAKLIALREVTGSQCTTVTLSGGNPCIHDLGFLIVMLKQAGFYINVETQGTKSPKWLDAVDLVTCSPKGPGMGESFNPKIFTEFVRRHYPHMITKIVIFDQRDIEFAADVFKIARGYGANDCFFSLGNPFPPQHANTRFISDAGIKLKLLEQYAMLSEELLQDRRFANAVFLPQLHVLAWGNKAEV